MDVITYQYPDSLLVWLIYISKKKALNENTYTLWEITLTLELLSRRVLVEINMDCFW